MTKKEPCDTVMMQKWQPKKNTNIYG